MDMNEKEAQALDYLGARLGQIYREKTFVNYVGDTSKIQEWFAQKKNIYIFGDCGKGKTHLLSALAHSILNHNFCIVKADRINDIASAYSSDDRASVISTWKHTATLFIDDIGIGKLTEERATVYYSVLDYRVSNGLQTLYTSNKRTDALWRGEGNADSERIVRRIRENCEGVNL
jgi:DNA replication protein DnaC